MAEVVVAVSAVLLMTGFVGVVVLEILIWRPDDFTRWEGEMDE